MLRVVLFLQKFVDGSRCSGARYFPLGQVSLLCMRNSLYCLSYYPYTDVAHHLRAQSYLFLCRLCCSRACLPYFSISVFRTPAKCLHWEGTDQAPCTGTAQLEIWIPRNKDWTWTWSRSYYSVRQVTTEVRKKVYSERLSRDSVRVFH